MLDTSHALAAALALALYALACARITRLVTTDTITAPPREWITERAYARALTRPFAELINCDWCASVWVAGALAALDALASGPLHALANAWSAPAALAWLIIVAAIAHAAGMLTDRT